MMADGSIAVAARSMLAKFSRSRSGRPSATIDKFRRTAQS